MPAVLDKVAKFYDDAIVRNGPVAQGVNWGDAHKHALRFAYLSEILKDERGPISVADVGCGYGALYDYLREQGHQLREYAGYDVAPKMVKCARERLAGVTGASVIQGAIIDREVDYAFASGTFNVRLGQDNAAWRNMIEDTLDNMHSRSRKGFAFNLMTDRVDWQNENLYYANSGEFLDRCLARYSRNVRLLHDMPLYEWTMLVFKR
jgi:SAM-dependent methyltransferase